MAFRPYAKCIHCGVALDLFADDEFDTECIDPGDGFIGAHDYDAGDPMGELQ